MSLDLRLAVPAAVAWAAAGVVIAAPAAATGAAIGCWALAGVLVAAAILARRGWFSAAAVALVAAAAVFSVVAVQAPARQPGELLAAAAAGRHLTLTIVTAETLGPGGPGGPGGASADPRNRDPPYSATLTAVRVNGAAAGAAHGAGPVVSGPVLSVPVLVFGARPAAPTGIGTSLTVSGTLSAAAPEDDVGFLLFARGSPRVVAPAPWFLDWANQMRASFSSAAARLPGDGGDLLPGLAIGDTTAVGPGLDAAMKASSLSHLTAVSGANCAVIIGLIMIGGRLAGVGRGVRIVASVAVLAGFVVLVTPQPSVVRAAVMAAIVLLALLGGRPVRGVPVLSLATLVLLVTDPWLSRDYGFALSVLATGGLLVLSGPLSRVLARRLPPVVALVIAVPLSAQLACQPVLLLLQPSLPLYGVIANALAEAAAPIATVVGLLACLTLPVLPWLGSALAAVAWLPASWIAATATFFSGLPGAALPWPGGVGGALLLAAVTVLGLVAVLGGVSRRSRLAAAAAAVTTLAAIAGAVAGVGVAERFDRPANWQLAVCDVGQGDAVVLRSGTEIALVDTGPDPDLLGHCLDTLGVGRIDLLILSHFDLDHIGGAEAIIGTVDHAIVGPTADRADDRLVARLRDAGASVEQVSRGDDGLFGELRWQVLWPRARLGQVEPGNDASVTVAFTGVGRCDGGCLGSLFLGDLGERSQAMVAAAGPLPAAEVVKVSHHGSADQSAKLYERVGATVGVIGVGAGNDYGHPTDRLLDLLAAAGTVAYRTDLSGLVLLSPGAAPGTVEVWTERAAPGG